jgi:multicomponent Na+:H+ antiporter subunit A
VLLALLAFHALLAAVAPPLTRRVGRGVFLVCGLAPLATVAWVATRAPAVIAGRPLAESAAWAPALGVSIDLRLDGFAVVMVALVSGIGTLIFAYAHSYFERPRDDLGKFAAALTGFAGSMLGLVLADNLLALFVFWELTSITSYLLIGFEDRKASARDAAQQALLVTGAGGLALLGGFVLIGQAADTYSLSAILAAPPSGAAANAGLVLCLLGAFTKSAQFPFHAWLPAAMAAPTPVSAYLHSATMVKAGVYLVARLAPAFAVAPVWRPLVIGVGVVTMLIGGYRALRQHDLKLLLAFGTVSQLGFMVALLGAGTPTATFAGVALLLAHGLFKAALFMATGIVDHAAGTRDLRRLSNAGSAMPAVFAASAVAAASMAGLPPLLGFISKEAAFEGFLHDGAGGLALAGVIVGSVLTFAYSARFLWGAFGRKDPSKGDADLVPAQRVERPAGTFAAPTVLLAGLTLMWGLWPRPLEPVVNAATAALIPAATPKSLVLWHGVNLALGISVLVVCAGAALFAGRRTVERYQSLVPPLPGSQDLYHAAVRGLLVGAKRLTGVVQNGSLPVYLTVILLTLLVLPGAQLVSVGLPAIQPLMRAGPLEAAVALAVVAAAAGAVVAGRRFSAVLFLGAVGFAVAGIFVVYGAPDLALTQVLIETLALVIFVLVLRHLPDRFSTPKLD